MVRAPPTVLVLKRGLHALGSAARSARSPRTTRASCRHRRARLDAAGRPVRDRRRVRPDGGAARADARTDRHPRRRAPHRDSRRARRRSRAATFPCEQYHRVERGHGRFSRAFSLPEIIDVDAHHRRSEGRHPDGHDSEGARSRHAGASTSADRTRYVPTPDPVPDAHRRRLRRRAGRHRPDAHGRRLERGRAARRTGADARAPSRGRRTGARAAVQAAGFSSGGPDFTRVAGQAVKGVANISSLQVVRTRNSPFPNDPFFRYFFGDDEQFGSRDRRSMSLGSGVIISADGYVVTNNHVVGEHVREITIALPDKREIKGKVIGTDPTTDIALLKIPATGLPVDRVGRFEPAEGRRMGAGDRQPVSTEPDRHRRHRQRHRPRQHGVRRLRGLHPDRRRDQPRQLRRRADQQPRRAGRDQHRHLQRERRLSGDRLRGAEQAGAARRRRPDAVRRGPARIDRAAGDREAHAAAGGGSRRDEHDRRPGVAHDAGVGGLRRRAEARRRDRRHATVRRSTTRRSSSGWWPTRSPARPRS